MMRLFLIEKSGGRKIDLGLFKFNDVSNYINAAKRKHSFLRRLETNGFDFHGETEPGPLRVPKKVKREYEQLTIE